MSIRLHGFGRINDWVHLGQILYSCELCFATTTSNSTDCHTDEMCFDRT